MRRETKVQKEKITKKKVEGKMGEVERNGKGLNRRSEEAWKEGLEKIGK